MNPKVSIIVRSKNEEKWISSCLASVFRQEFKDFEVILVDNNSTDKTVEKAKKFPVAKIVNIDQFLPGKALNLGVRNSTGEYLVNLSAHCIPVDSKWLGALLDAFDDPSIAGVYGRQEPMAFSSDLDKRDLINTFGLDKKIQKKDPFFHNANSMIRRDVWEKYPFSETATNIEDRIWAKEILEQGYTIVYDPEASVYHYHGINQGRNLERARNVVRILEELHPKKISVEGLSDLNVTAIVPVKTPVKTAGGVSLLEISLESLKKSKHVSKIVVAADNEEHIEIARKMGVQTLLRPPDLSYDFVDLVSVYQFALKALDEQGEYPDLLFLAQEKYPFRSPWLVDNMVEQYVRSGSDSVIAASPLYNSLWREEDNNLVRLDKGLMPTKYKEPVMRALYGLGCLIQAHLVEEGRKIGHQAGLCVVNNTYSSIVVENAEDMNIVESVLPKWREYVEKRSK
ncbi:glycosyl transferase family 2 [Desulfatibacillum aliphaticivorans]|uniref:Glycosyl transferase family 2 n=1 Tax=Desulfatibacillum aliphaticivorans TaxID=218208 RepID=B8FAS0_DESAL|nr:glycosyltransferase [Desulfatibacillum aliphaticivorans]ACL03366.1 glycosyl transferase family 2 [Desulfatibacillum aliphaticivorans]